MTYLWYVSHYVRKNYFSLNEKYRGKTVVFQIKDYNDLKNMNIADENEITAMILSVKDGFYERIQNDPYFNKRIYFPLEEEYTTLMQNYRQKTKNVSFERPNNFDFNLEIYFEKNIDIFPGIEVDNAIIDRIDEYITKKDQIMRKIESHKSEQEQLRLEAREIRENIGKISAEELNNKFNEFKTKIQQFDVPDNNNLILITLLSKLFLRGSEKVLVYLRNNPFNIFPNIGNDLGRIFDYKEPISQEFMNFILYMYREKNTQTLDHFIENMVFYNSERRKDIKKILYTENIALLKTYYGCMFRAVDNEITESLKEKVLTALETMKGIDFSNLRASELAKVTNVPDIRIAKYKQELEKVKNDFINKKLTKDEYKEFLFSKESLQEKMKNIAYNFNVEELITPITEYFKNILSDNSLSYKEKDLVYNFLYAYDFKRFNEVEPIIKEQLLTDINFNYQILRKIHFSEQELQQLKNHPSFTIRYFVLTKLGYKQSDPEYINMDTEPLRKFIPIITYQGIPHFLGYFLNDNRIFVKINNIDRTKIETINNKKEIVKLDKMEMMELITRENEYYIENYKDLLEENNKDLAYYILIEGKKSETNIEYINRVKKEHEELIKKYRNNKE